MLTSLGTAELQRDDAEGSVKLERTLALARRYGLHEHAARAFCGLVPWALRTRRLATASDYLDRALEHCSEPGLDSWRTHLLAYRARLELDLGNWNTVTDLCGIVLHDPKRPPAPRAWVLTALGLIRARRGDPDSHGPLDEGFALANCTGEFQGIAAIAAARAEAAWLAGDDDTVATRTAAALEIARRRGAGWVVGELA